MQRCLGHKGMLPLTTNPGCGIKALKCTNCRSCQECRQPVPLVIPEGKGGSRCSAEVAAKAEALRGAALSKASSSERGLPKQVGGTGGAS
jgi:hypothetical protein